MSLHPAVPLHEENTRACWSCSHARPRSPTRDLPAAQILPKLPAQKRLQAFLPKLAAPSVLLYWVLLGSCYYFFGGVRREGLCDLRSPLGRPAGRLRLSLRRRRSRAPRSSGQVRARGSGCALARLPPPAGPTTRCPHLPSPGAALHRPHVWGAPTSPPPGTPNDPKFRAGAGWPRLTQAERRQGSQRARGPRLCRRRVHGGPPGCGWGGRGSQRRGQARSIPSGLHGPRLASPAGHG